MKFLFKNTTINKQFIQCAKSLTEFPLSNWDA